VPSGPPPFLGACFHRVIGANPPAHPNLSAVGRIQLQDRRLALAQRKALVHLGSFTGGAHFQLRAALGMAPDIEIQAPSLSRLRVARTHQPRQTKHRRRNIEEAFVLHKQLRPPPAVSKGTDQSVPRSAFCAAWGGALWAAVCPRVQPSTSPECPKARFLRRVDTPVCPRVCDSLLHLHHHPLPVLFPTSPNRRTRIGRRFPRLVRGTPLPGTTPSKPDRIDGHGARVLHRVAHAHQVPRLHRERAHSHVHDPRPRRPHGHL